MCTGIGLDTIQCIRWYCHNYIIYCNKKKIEKINQPTALQQQMIHSNGNGNRKLMLQQNIYIIMCVKWYILLFGGGFPAAG